MFSSMFRLTPSCGRVKTFADLSLAFINDLIVVHNNYRQQLQYLMWFLCSLTRLIEVWLIALTVFPESLEGENWPYHDAAATISTQGYFFCLAIIVFTQLSYRYLISWKKSSHKSGITILDKRSQTGLICVMLWC